MKYTWFLRQMLLTGILFVPTAHLEAADGTINTTFGNQGFVVTPVSGAVGSAWNSVQIQPNGEIIAAGYTVFGSTNQTVVGRYLANGTLDPSFNSGKPFTFQFSNDTGGSMFNAVIVVPDCKIIAAGSASISSVSEGLLVQYNTDGSLDTSFGQNGATLQTILADFTALALQPNGQIIVVGSNASNNSIGIARYNINGSLDMNFGQNGVMQFTPPGATNSSAISVQLLSNGQIIVGGTSRIGVNTQFVVARFNANGTLDTSFGTSSGFTITPAPSGAEFAPSTGAIGIQSDGKIIFASETSNLEGIVGRYNANGTLDITYGNGGFTVTQIGTSTVWNSLVIQADNKAVTAGSATISFGNDMFAVGRYLTNGTLDPSFGTNGTATFTDNPAANVFANSLAIARTIQGNGDIVLAGLLQPGATQELGLVGVNNTVKLIPDPVSCVTQQIYNLYCGGC